MDTDVEVVKPFDDLLNCQAFMCFENDRLVSIGTLGAIKESSLIREFLDSYERKQFLKGSNIKIYYFIWTYRVLSGL